MSLSPCTLIRSDGAGSTVELIIRTLNTLDEFSFSFLLSVIRECLLSYSHDQDTLGKWRIYHEDA